MNDIRFSRAKASRKSRAPAGRYVRAKSKSESFEAPRIIRTNDLESRNLETSRSRRLVEQLDVAFLSSRSGVAVAHQEHAHEED